MKTLRVIYWIVTGLLCLMMFASGVIYIVKYDEIAKTFVELHYPAYIVYPLAVAKLLGVIAILTKKSKTLKEWAYAGFFFDFLLAAGAHYDASLQLASPIIALVLLLASYALDRKIYGKI